jgi:hypothetical protein
MLYLSNPPTIPEHTAITLVQGESALESPTKPVLVLADRQSFSPFCETTLVVGKVDIAVKKVVKRVAGFLRIEGGVR